MPEPEGADPVTPTVLSLSRTPLRDSIAAAIAHELKHVPVNTFEAHVFYEDGTLRASTAYRIDRDRWAVTAGAFVEKPKDAPANFGAFGKVTVTF